MKIRELRVSKGLTGEDMSTVIGTNAATYYKKEMGMLRFSLQDAKKIADFFKSTIEDVFYSSEESPVDIQPSKSK